MNMGLMKNQSRTEIEAQFMHKNDASITELEAECIRVHENEAFTTEIAVGFAHRIIAKYKL